MMKILSYGGGADSFAMTLDALDRGERPDECVFADTGSPRGDGGEWPETYDHMRRVALPLCEREGIPFVWITTDMYPIRGRESLLRYFEETRTMPTRMSRMCSAAAKIERIERYVLEHHPGSEIEMWIGFEAGEEKRIANDPHARGEGRPGWRNRFPLAERSLCRCRAVSLIKSHGLEVPPKSACVYCPFSSRGDFQTLERQHPEVFDRVARMEENCKTTRSGKVMRYSFDGPALREWVSRTYKPRPKPCPVCGAEVREPKRVGCGVA